MMNFTIIASMLGDEPYTVALIVSFVIAISLIVGWGFDLNNRIKLIEKQIKKNG